MRNAGALRALAAFVALFAAGAHLSALLHFALVSHGICADHGELVHAGHGHRATAAHGAAKTTVDRAADAADAHEHCLFVARLRECVTSARQAEVELPARSETQHATPPDVVVLSSRDILLMAPKQSPPA